jgi:alpha-maltose-1-phosphate synthase
MRIVQTVFGVFHHFELARELERRGHLQAIYSTFPWARLKREGIPRHRVHTFPWLHTPEMALLKLNLNIPALRDPLNYANALAFDQWTLRQLRSSPVPDALIAISGSSLLTGRELQSRGRLMICDRGSSHHRYQHQLVADEYARWHVHRPIADPRDIAREEEIYQLADAITVPSNFAARSFVQMGLAASKIHIVPYGVRLEQFSPAPSPPPADRFEVLFAGSVGLRKGVPYLLEAFHQLRHPTKRLRLAGRLHPDLKSVLHRLPRDSVEFLGPVTQTRLAQLMASSHLMVLPSIEEGLALVQGQALACGCPVLSTTNAGAEDLFEDGVEGFIVPIRNVPALTEKMQLLADDPALRLEMREAALLRVHSLGGWQQFGDLWEHLLQNLTGKS